MSIMPAAPVRPGRFLRPSPRRASLSGSLETPLPVITSVGKK